MISTFVSLDDDRFRENQSAVKKMVPEWVDAPLVGNSGVKNGTTMGHVGSGHCQAMDLQMPVTARATTPSKFGDNLANLV